MTGTIQDIQYALVPSGDRRKLTENMIQSLDNVPTFRAGSFLLGM